MSADPGGGGGAGAGAGGGGGGEGGAAPVPCLHDPCIEGSQLHPACSPCVAAICEEIEYCCEVRWEFPCVDAVARHPDVCTCGPEQSCQNLSDEDLDGAYDCLDRDCQATGACAPGSGLVGDPCTENTDCAAARGAPLCVGYEEFQWTGGYCSELCTLGAPCGGGIGLCADIGLGDGHGVCYLACDPLQADACRPGYACREDNTPGFACLPVHEDCVAPGDEDADGAAECADFDCAGVFECFENCADGLDDNASGNVDCDDPTCIGEPACEAELAPVCTAPPAPRAGCVELGGQYQCDPVTGEGCLPGQTCSLVGGGFLCFGPPNDVGLCEKCGGLKGRCAPGMSCMSAYDSVCAAFCCADEDCGPGGHCNRAALALTLADPTPPPVGVCVVGEGGAR